MKSPLSRLRELALHRGEPKKEHRRRKAEEKLDDLVEATQDMQDMKNCYDSILSVATSAANNAYEFSESIEELGTCLLEKIELNDDEDSGRALMIMGRAQFELQKLFSAYRSHIFQTMAKPSASLLRELEIVEEMKRRCDDKREVYKNMLAANRTKGRVFHAKSRTFSLKELQEAQADYEGEADHFVFRLKSLKQGQFRSLLTQTARHHAAQLSFFRKGLKALEMVEPHMKAVAEKQHIDYQFKELDNDNVSSSEYNSDDDRELSFGHQHRKQDQDVVPIPRNSVEEISDKSQPNSHIFSNRSRPSSQSAPIFSEKKFDPSENIRKSHPSSTRKFSSYVLPTPSADGKSGVSSNPDTCFSKGSKAGAQLWFSSPLDAKGTAKDSFLYPAKSPERSSIAAKEEKVARSATPYFPKMMIPPMSRYPDTKMLERQAFSGPITGKPKYSATQYRSFMNIHPTKSAPLSPPHRSIPKISELHELPRPPIRYSGKMEKSPPPLVGHSAPLIARGRSALPLPLPTPTGPMARSFSIPSGGPRAPKYAAAKLLGATDTKVVVSPPLTPV